MSAVVRGHPTNRDYWTRPEWARSCALQKLDFTSRISTFITFISTFIPVSIGKIVQTKVNYNQRFASPVISGFCFMRRNKMTKAKLVKKAEIAHI